MRAFIGQFDRVSLAIAALGIGVGIIWLVAVDLGVALAGVVLAVGAIALIAHHRWIEIAILMVSLGATVDIGYRLLGPPVPPREPEGFVPPTEVYAPGLAPMLWVGGGLLGIVVGVWDVREGRRRERLEARHRRRRGMSVEQP